jgi:hypothetical protein
MLMIIKQLGMKVSDIQVMLLVSLIAFFVAFALLSIAELYMDFNLREGICDDRLSDVIRFCRFDNPHQ